jgi:hypothetical protein
MERSNTCPTCRAVIPSDNNGADVPPAAAAGAAGAPPANQLFNLFGDQGAQPGNIPGAAPAAPDHNRRVGPFRLQPPPGHVNRRAFARHMNDPPAGQFGGGIANANEYPQPTPPADIQAAADYIGNDAGINDQNYNNFLAQVANMQRGGAVDPLAGDQEVKADTPTDDQKSAGAEVLDERASQLALLQNQTMMVETQMDYHRSSLAFLQQQYEQLIHLQMDMARHQAFFGSAPNPGSETPPVAPPAEPEPQAQAQ